MELSALTENSEYSSVRHGEATETALAFIKETAAAIIAKTGAVCGNPSILSRECDAEAARRIYSEMLSAPYMEYRPIIENKSFVSFASRRRAEAERIILCKYISESYKTSEKSNPEELFDILYSSDKPDNVENGERRIAYMRTSSSDAAFERFARSVFGATAVYGDSFASICEAVAGKKTEYSIVPVWNSIDGRLDGIYRIIEKNELFIIQCTTAEHDGISTKFALLSAFPSLPETKGSVYYECRITFEKPLGLSILILGAEYFNAEIESFTSLPVSYYGRENAYSFTFCLDKCDFAGFFTYLFYEFPQCYTTALYMNTSGEKRGTK